MIYILAATVGADFLVDLWWYGSLGYGSYFWVRNLYGYLVFFLTVGIFFAVFFVNFRLAVRYIGTVSRSAVDKVRARKINFGLYRRFRDGSPWVTIPLSLILSIIVCVPLVTNWEQFLLFMNLPDSGLFDPAFGRDVSYYLGALPIYRMIHGRLFLAFAVAFAGILGVYLYENRIFRGSEGEFTKGEKRHLGILFGVLVLLGFWHFLLDRFGLLLETRNLPVFRGPGHVEMTWILTFIWIAALSTLALGVTLSWAVSRKRRFWIPGIFAVLIVVSLLGRYSDGIRNVVNRLRVEPNELALQTPYIQNNIDATLAAFDLEDVEIREYVPGDGPESTVPPREVLRNIPLWRQQELRLVFDQLQELRTFYVFAPVDVGRYRVEGSEQQVFLSAREIDISEIPAERQTWINRHLSFTHGYGAVMSSANQLSDVEIPWLLHGIPTVSEFGLTPAEPRVYYGLGRHPYIVVPNDLGEVDGTGGPESRRYSYQGSGGVPIDTVFRRMVYWTHFREPDLFLSTRFVPESRILYRRNILDRVGELVPFLTLDSDPYLAATEEGLHWMIDAYTTSELYPYAASADLGGESVNYLRNSVKIVVDAYDGTVDFYITDEDDPLIRGYADFYSMLFKPLDEMPEDLRAHVRYPRDLFAAQLEIYADYHQSDADTFYRAPDVWEPSPTPLEDTERISPRYITANLIEPDRLDYSLVLPVVPKGRQNLRAIVVAGADPGNYGRIVVNSFPRGELVFGFAQVDALINEEPEISEQFTLWGQEGSTIVQGGIIALPLGPRILYIEPVFLEATEGPAVPQLERVIISEGTMAVMGESLGDAYEKLLERIAAEGTEEPG